MLVLAALAIPPLFYLLGKAAGLAVANVQTLARRNKLPLSILGILLGLLTSLPEFIIGVHALIAGVPDLSLGNLLGGLPILFGGILGASIIFSGKVTTDGHPSELTPYLAYLILPLLLGLDKQIGWIDALICIGCYGYLVFHLHTKVGVPKKPPHDSRASTGQALLLTLLAVFIVIVSSHIIVKLAVLLLMYTNLSAFGVGTIVFALGTNLPEMSVAFASWRRNRLDIAWSSLVGSGMANILFLGLFALIRPYTIIPEKNYLFFGGWLFLIFLLLATFYRSDRALKRNEGWALFAVFLAGFIIQALLLIP